MLGVGGSGSAARKLTSDNRTDRAASGAKPLQTALTASTSGRTFPEGTFPPGRYLLEVAVTVGLEASAEYRTRALGVRKLIEGKTDLRLLVAAEAPAQNHFFHLWSLPDADSLLDGMRLMAESAEYRNLDRLVVREQQDLLAPLAGSRHMQPRENAKSSYIKVSGYVATRDLAEYQALNEVSPRRLEVDGLVSHGSFLNVTGRINRVVSLWKTTNGAVDARALAKIPGLRFLDEVEVATYRSTSYA
jgi:hypothetical protein